MAGLYDHFFDLMEDLGFFEHIYENLPPDFTAVFEIARVLEDANHALTARLAPALSLARPALRTQTQEAGEDQQVILTTSEEDEAGLIRSPQHVSRMYNSQWLLPEDVLWRKLAKKELWVPYPKEPTYYAVDPDEEEYRPDGRKQKLYILLDTSSSMAMRNRINLAKAIVYHVLAHNLKELGYIHLRTFDVKVGELHEARDRESYHGLLSFIMRLHTLGNGTAMAKAITQAVEDISRLPQLSGTEILVITDGACALDEQAIRSLLGDQIVINTVKIGKSQLIASKSLIHDRIFEEDTAQHRLIADMQSRERELARQLEHAQSPNARRKYEESLRSLRAEMNRQVDAMTEEIVVGYGHELERLSEVYVAVDDIDMAAMLPAGGTHIDALENLHEMLLQRGDEQALLDLLRKLTILHDHLQYLLQNTRDPAQKARLEALDAKVAASLRQLLEAGNDEQHSLLDYLAPEDRHDIQYLLQASHSMGLSLWKLLLRRIMSRLRRISTRKS